MYWMTSDWSGRRWGAFQPLCRIGNGVSSFLWQSSTFSEKFLLSVKSLLSGSWWVSSSHPFPVYNLESWNYVVRICYVVISFVLVLLLLLQSVLWALPILQMISGNVSCSLQLRIVQIVISNFRIGLWDAKVGGQNPRFLFFSSDHIGPIKCVHNQIWNG